MRRGGNHCPDARPASTSFQDVSAFLVRVGPSKRDARECRDRDRERRRGGWSGRGCDDDRVAPVGASDRAIGFDAELVGRTFDQAGDSRRGRVLNRGRSDIGPRRSTLDSLLQSESRFQRSIGPGEGNRGRACAAGSQYRGRQCEWSGNRKEADGAADRGHELV